MRKIITFIFLFVIIILFGITTASAESQIVSLTLFPATIIQGDPFMVQIEI